MSTVRFTIRGECASKSNSRRLVNFGKRAAVVKSQKALDYEASAILQIPQQARVMFTGPVRVTLRIFYASERPDLDESVVLDVLQARYAKGTRELVRFGVYGNDRQVREKHVFHGIDRDNPRAEIEVEALTPQQDAMFRLQAHTKPAPPQRRLKPPDVQPGADPF